MPEVLRGKHGKRRDEFSRVRENDKLGLMVWALVNLRSTKEHAKKESATLPISTNND